MPAIGVWADVELELRRSEMGEKCYERVSGGTASRAKPYSTVPEAMKGNSGLPVTCEPLPQQTQTPDIRPE